MTRRLTLLFAALEGAIVLGIGVAIPLVPLTLLWALQYGFGPDWAVFWRAAVDVWLIGHGVDVTLRLDPALAGALDLRGAGDPVPITIALLGFALLTLLLGARAGGRIAETGHRLLGGLAATGAFAVLSLAVTATALHSAARPSLVQGALLPALVFGAGILISVLRAGAPVGPDAPGSSIRDWIADWPLRVRLVVAASLRAGAAAAVAVLLVASVTVTALIVVNYAELIRLYEALHAEVVGGLALTAGQLALLPNLVVWAAAWFVGPGFAIGTGSSVSPLGTTLGPLPAVPVLGALPSGDLDFAFAGVMVPVVAGFLAGAVVRGRLARGLGRDGRPWWLAGTALGTGLVGGGLLALLSWWSAGAAGPGRLVDVGPDPLMVGLWAALELAVGAGLGIAAAGVGGSILGRGDELDDPSNAALAAARAEEPSR